MTFSGRFYDFLERRDGRWAIVRRQPIYEKDRLDVLEPGADLRMNADLLARFPEGYRHLAYIQSQIGYQIATGLPSLTGPAVAQLYAEGDAWLRGSDNPGRSHLLEWARKRRMR